MPDYQNSKIYKLYSNEGPEVYIGSTTQPLCRRKQGHKDKKSCSSKILFEKYEEVIIELIEYYKCNNKEELNKREGEHIRMTDCINKRIAGRTNKEWREDNSEYLKKYREDNKEHIKEQKKEYYEENLEFFKDYIKNYREQNIDKIKEQTKKYREQNKDKILERDKKYYKKNLDKIKERKKKYREKNKEEINQRKREQYHNKELINSLLE